LRKNQSFTIEIVVIDAVKTACSVPFILKEQLFVKIKKATKCRRKSKCKKY